MRNIHDPQAHIIFTRFQIYIKVDEDIALNECKLFVKNDARRRSAERKTYANGKQTCIQCAALFPRCLFSLILFFLLLYFARKNCRILEDLIIRHKTRKEFSPQAFISIIILIIAASAIALSHNQEYESNNKKKKKEKKDKMKSRALGTLLLDQV